MIKTFRCAETENPFNGVRVRRFVNIELVARRKLEMVAAAKKLEDLRSPAGQPAGSVERRPRRAAQHPREQSVPRVLSVE